MLLSVFTHGIVDNGLQASSETSPSLQYRFGGWAVNRLRNAGRLSSKVPVFTPGATY